jgi:hypothetical protein
VQGFLILDLVGARLASAFLRQLTAVRLFKPDSTELQKLEKYVFHDTSTLVYPHKLATKKILTFVNVIIQLFGIPLDPVGFVGQFNRNLGVCLRAFGLWNEVKLTFYRVSVVSIYNILF